MTGICNSVRPNRRYFIAGEYAKGRASFNGIPKFS